MNQENLNKELIIASMLGIFQNVKSSIEKGADIHVNNDSALSWASNNGYLDIVKYLVSKGSNIHNNNNESSLRSAS